MDFLSRLIGGSGAPRGQKNVHQPQARLATFKRSYNQALTICHRLNNASEVDPSSLALVQTHIQRLTHLLEDDVRGLAPHLCLNFASSSFVYTALSRIASTLRHDPITREVVTFFNVLVDSDQETLIASDRFTDTLTRFVDGVLGPDATWTSSDTQDEALELIFGIAAKVRLEPELLPVWFRRRIESPENEKLSSEGLVSVEDHEFPLCHHFVWHVYRDGRAGDFARTGLLYILESASNSESLERWIADSDLPTLMASGLGGLYSQLSRKLSIARPKEELPLILALSDSAEHPASSEADSLFSEDLQIRLDAFMSCLIFWQDVLEHCHSDTIKQTLLDRFQVEFLEQILYPALLQSSDIDGGSSVAVLTYLGRILSVMEHPDIISRILNYLLDMPGHLPGRSSSGPIAPHSRTETAREQAVALSPNRNDDPDSVNPSFFNLTDLVLSSCRSPNPETVTAALQLVNVIISRHQTYAVSGLIKVQICSRDFMTNRSSGMRWSPSQLVELAVEVAGMEGVEEAYENSIKDCVALLESHLDALETLPLDATGIRSDNRMDVSVNHKRETRECYNLSKHDPLMEQLMLLLETFLTNDIESNLSLTSAISRIVSDPFLILGAEAPTGEDSRMRTVISSTIDDEAFDGAVLEADNDLGLPNHVTARTLASEITGDYLAPLTRALSTVSDSVAKLKMAIPEFDSLLAGRKRAFRGATELEDELDRPKPNTISSPRGSIDQPRGSFESRSVHVAAFTPLSPTTPDRRVNSPRGRTMSILAGRRSQSPAMSPRSFDALRRPLSPASPPAKPPGNTRRTSQSPPNTPRALSPLTGDEQVIPGSGQSDSEPDRRDSGSREELYDRRLRFPLVGPGQELLDSVKRSKAGHGDEEEPQLGLGSFREASLTHVLSNVVILQDFVLELAAILHVRAALLEDT